MQSALARMGQSPFPAQSQFRYAVKMIGRSRRGTINHGRWRDRHSREARVAAYERERQVVQLYIRGLTFAEIARQLGMQDHSGASKAFKRAIKRIPPADVELLRKPCGSSKLNPRELVGGFERLAIACLHGDADKRSGLGRPEASPEPAPRCCWKRSPCAIKLPCSSAAELVARAFAFGLGCFGSCSRAGGPNGATA
jgi:AraC-like DNA-binding protein